jgi:hypothetical protein
VIKGHWALPEWGVGAALWSPGHSVRTIGAGLAEAAPRRHVPVNPNSDLGLPSDE